MHRNLSSFLLLLFVITSLSGCYSLGWRFDECLYSDITNVVEDSGARRVVKEFPPSVEDSPTNIHGYTATEKTTLPTTVATTYCRGLNLAINQKHYAVIPDHDDLSPVTSTRSSKMTAGIVFQTDSPGNKALLYKEGEYGLHIGSRLITFSLYNSGGATLHSLTFSEQIDIGIPYLVFGHYEQNYPLFGSTDRLTLYMYSWDGTTWQEVERISDTFAISNLSNTGSDLLIGKAGRSYFDGIIDEAFISDDLLSLSDIVRQSEAGVCTPCGTSLDHYEIRHSGLGVTCEAEPVTITAHDSLHEPITPGTTITISTTPAADAWGLQTGTLANFSDLGSGQAEYTFASGDESSVVLLMTRLTAATINIDVADSSGTSETSGTATGPEDPLLDFRDSAFRFYADGMASSIGPQIAGKESNLAPAGQSLRLSAIQTNTDTGACEARLTGKHNVPLAFACVDPATCKSASGVTITGIDSSGVAITPTAIADNRQGAVTNYTSVPLEFDAGGTAPFTMRYADAGQIALHAEMTLPAMAPDPAITLTGSSNTFTVVPAGLCVESSDADSACLAIDRDGDLDVDDDDYALCSIFKRAGEAFNLAVRAVAWESTGETDSDFCTGNATTPNFQLNTIAITTSVVAPADGTAGTSDIAAFDMVSSDDGDHTLSQWVSEVGVFTFTATPPLYFGAAIAASTSANIGRFIPDHFTVSVANTGSFANTGTNPTFTYLGEPFGYSTADEPQFTITAVNTTSTTTTNYTGAFNKIDLSDISLSYPIIDTSQLDETNALFSLTSTTGSHLLTDNNNGTTTLTLGATATDRFAYDRQQGLVTPFSPDLTIALTTINETDDAVTSSSGPIGVAPDGSAVELRFGRATLRNTFGPETEDQAMPLILEYYDGSDFLSNDLDTNSVFVAIFPAPPPPTDLTCSDAPPAGDSIDCSMVAVNDLTVRHDETFNLAAPGTDNTGVLQYTLAVPSWLEFDWDGDGTHDNDPRATATFGIYRGNDRIINWREVIQ